MNTAYYGISSLVFGIIMFFPLRKMILSMTINRHQNKVNRAITEEELDRLKNKVTPIAAVLAVTFAFLYNKVLLLKLMGPPGQ